MAVRPAKESKMGVWSKYYLAAYNGFQAVGWGYLFVQGLRFLGRNGTTGLWSKSGSCLLALQSLAGLEVLHCLIGLVPSSAVVTAAQVASRLFQVWGIIYSIEEVQNYPTVAVVMMAWGLTEVIRYSFYFANLYGKSPYFLTWCRYSFFLALYPLGVIGEVSNTVIALGPIRDRQVYSIALPNVANCSFNYYYFTIFILMLYLPIFPKLFFHMWHQRVKVLGSSKSGHSHLNVGKKSL